MRPIIVLVLSTLLAGCLATSGTVDRATGSAVDLTRFKDGSKDRGSIIIEAVDFQKIADASDAVMEEKGFKTQVISLDPFVMTLSRRHEYDLGDQLLAGFASALGGANLQPFPYVDHVGSILAVPVVHEGRASLRLSGRIQTLTQVEKSDIYEGKNGVFSMELLTDISGRAGAMVINNEG